MVAYCGLNCNECKVFKATQAEDYEQKKQIARHWSDQGEIKFKPEDVDCHGCKSDIISGFCRKLCELRPCAEEKKVKTCAARAAQTNSARDGIFHTFARANQ
jgi:hypothetical protein